MPAIKVELYACGSAPMKIDIENRDQTSCARMKNETENGDNTGYAPIKIKTDNEDHTDHGCIMNKKIKKSDCESRGPVPTRKPQKRMYGAFLKPAKFSFMKPILHEHRQRLVFLINKLAKKHSWRDASGALSILMKGTPRGCSVIEDRKHFLVAMELLRHFPCSNDYIRRIKHIYEVWMSKLAWARKCTKKKHLIQMELALFCLTQGSIREAHNTMKFLVQDRESVSDPHVHLIHGLTSYQLWYSELPEEMQLTSFDVHMQQTEASDMALGDGFTQQIRSEGMSGGSNSVDIQCIKTYAQCNSESSIRNDKNPRDHNMDTPRKQPRPCQHAPEFYVNGSSVTNETRDAASNLVSNLADISIFHTHGLDATLLPIKLQQSTDDLEFRMLSHRKLMNENYVDAVKHLKIALHSDPPLLSALQPFIQLLLLGDQVEEALKELEDLSHNSKSSLPLRYRARLMECVCSNRYMELAKCYEEILKVDPACVSSLQRLINMHMNGVYGTAHLLEWIALHLDHTDGTPSIWSEFASCLLKIQSVGPAENEDALSTTRPKVVNYATHSLTTKKVPKAFIKGEARRTWAYRCKWWSKRHFNRAIYNSEIQAGEWQLQTSKAACACHLYGPKSHYVREVLSSLRRGDEELRSILLRHREHSLRLSEALAGQNINESQEMTMDC